MVLVLGEEEAAMRKTVSCMVILLAVGVYLAAQNASDAPVSAQDDAPVSPKHPWQWTDEERVEVRFDPNAMKARLDRHFAKAEAEGRSIRFPPQLVVDGASNPELLMPWEVFERLLTSGFSDGPRVREAFRASVAEQATAILGSKHNLWAILEDVAFDFLASRREEMALARTVRAATSAERKKIFAEIEVVQSPQCGYRADALRAARLVYGADSFDRFLYEAVAPRGTLVGSLDRTRAEHRSLLLFVQGGCK